MSFDMKIDPINALRILMLGANRIFWAFLVPKWALYRALMSLNYHGMTRNQSYVLVSVKF